MTTWMSDQTITPTSGEQVQTMDYKQQIKPRSSIITTRNLSERERGFTSGEVGGLDGKRQAQLWSSRWVLSRMCQQLRISLAYFSSWLVSYTNQKSHRSHFQQCTVGKQNIVKPDSTQMNRPTNPMCKNNFKKCIMFDMFSVLPETAGVLEKTQYELSAVTEKWSIFRCFGSAERQRSERLTGFLPLECK